MNGHVARPFEQAAVPAAGEAIAHAPNAASSASAAAAEPELPVLDDAVFAATAGFLRPADLERILQTLIARGDALLEALRAPALPARAGALAAAAHMFAGSAGMFGFARVVPTARRFESAAVSGAPETTALAAELAAATEASVAAMGRRSAAIQAAAI